MLSKIARSQRGFATTFKKVQVANPVVDMDGDEMTRIIWQWIKERVSYITALTASTPAHPSLSGPQDRVLRSQRHFARLDR